MSPTSIREPIRRGLTRAAALGLLVLAAQAPSARAQGALRVFLPSVQASHPVTARLVAEIGGGGTVVALADGVAYLGRGHRVVVVDRRERGRLTEVGEVGPLSGYVRKLVVSGDRLMVGMGSEGLQALDIRDPLHPRLLGGANSPGYASGLAVDGRLVALADGPGGLRTFGLGDDGRLTPLGTLDTLQGATGVALEGSLAYVTVADARSAGLLVVDLADPANPREIGSAGVSGSPSDVAVHGGRAYVAAGGAGVPVIDVSDPRHPRLVHDLQPDGTMHTSKIIIDGPLAYLWGTMEFRNWVLDGFWVIDLTDPAAPRTVGRFNQSASLSWDIALSGGEVLLAGPFDALAHYVPQDAAWRRFATLDQTVGRIKSVLGDGDPAHADVSWTAQGPVYESGLLRLGLEDPAHPRIVARVSTRAIASTFRRVVCADGARVVVTGEGHPIVVDGVDEGTPRGTWRKPEDLWTVGLGQCRDGLAYLAEDASRFEGRSVPTRGLRIYDLRPADGPRLLSRFDLLPAMVDAVDVEGDRVYLTTDGPESPRLLVLDAADPNRPALLGERVLPRRVHALDVVGGVAFALEAEGGGLATYDVTYPGQTRTLGRMPTPLSSDVAVGGGLAWIAGRGLQLVDISDPADPQVVADLSSVSAAVEVSLRGDIAYVTDDFGGLQVFRVP